MTHRRLGIMQPYFLPYLGYWQLINACDSFVIYDDIQYTKKGWMNRNRMLSKAQQDVLFTLPVKGGASIDTVMERQISPEFDRQKFLVKLNESYRYALYYPAVFPILKKIVEYNDTNLFGFLLNSIECIMKYLEIKTPLIISSTLAIPREVKGQDKVLMICEKLQAREYINPIGGMDLYDKDVFTNHGIDLGFLKMGEIVYPQFENDFIPYLSIIDVMMFNSVETIRNYLVQWEKV